MRTLKTDLYKKGATTITVHQDPLPAMEWHILQVHSVWKVKFFLIYFFIIQEEKGPLWNMCIFDNNETIVVRKEWTFTSVW